MLALPARKLVLVIGSIVLVLYLITVTVISLTPSKETLEKAVEVVKNKSAEKATAEVEPKKLVKDEKKGKSSDDKATNDTTVNANTATPAPKSSEVKTQINSKPKHSEVQNTSAKDTLKPKQPAITKDNKEEKVSHVGTATKDAIKAPSVKATEQPLNIAVSNPLPDKDKVTEEPVVAIKDPVKKSDNTDHGSLEPPNDTKPAVIQEQLNVLPTAEVSTTETISTTAETKTAENGTVKPTPRNNLKIEEIEIVPCGPKNMFVCGSFIISCFPDGHVVKIFFGNKDKANYDEIIPKTYKVFDDEDGFDVGKVIENLGGVVEVDGVNVQHTNVNGNLNIIESLKTETFKQVFSSISDKLTEAKFFIVFSGPAKKVESFKLGKNLYFLIKDQLLDLFEGRYFGSFEISGFNSNKVIKIFMSLVKVNKEKYYAIQQALSEIDGDNFEKEFAKLPNLMGKMTNPVKAGDDVTFSHTVLESSWSTPKQPNLGEFSSQEFTKFFWDLRNINTWTMQGMDFFVVLTGTSYNLEKFELGVNTADMKKK